MSVSLEGCLVWDILSKKVCRDEIQNLPIMRKKKDFVSIDDVDMPLDNKGDYITKALNELRSMDAEDRKSM